MATDVHPTGGCDFCNKTPDQVKRLFKGKTGHQICNECAVIAKDIAEQAIADDEKKAAAAKVEQKPKPVPRKFFYLDDYR